ncbi:Pyridoxal phosphate phosphatase YigL [Buchnera aphidicola (Eriosoma lanigerum)]|uniref:Cof-type HAD-IIB family hydrolase n=1 Tax=Buchnera aphidicola TaxID=9 RepID=UPI003463E937
MYNIVASDLDGTLLTSKYKITDFTKKTLLSLTSQGLHFVFATGRHHIDVFKLSDELNIQSYMITSNGAKIYDNNKKLIFNRFLKKNIVMSLCTIRYIDIDIVTQLYCTNQWYIHSNQFNKHKFCNNLFLKFKILNLNKLTFMNINKIFFTSHNIKKLELLKKEILHIWSDKFFNIFFSFPECLEIVPKGISKGLALKFVAERLGYSLNHCITFGDGMNDQDMLSMSGKGCIMNNADPRLKSILPNLEIIGNNNEDGVAHYLRNLYQFT